MRYQDLIDKYSNPNYNLATPSNANVHSYNRLDVPSKSLYTSQTETPSSYRSKSRKKLEYNPSNYETTLKATDRYTDNKRIDSSTDNLFKSGIVHSEIASPLERVRSPRNSGRRDDLRKTAGPEYTYRDGIAKQLAYHTSAANLLKPSYDKPKYDLARDMSHGDLRKTMGSGLDKGYFNTNQYPKPERTAFPTTSSALVYKQNNAPQETPYLGLTQSTHQRRLPPEVPKPDYTNQRLFMSSAGVSGFSGKSSRTLAVDSTLDSSGTSRQAKVYSSKSNRDLGERSPLPTSKFMQEKQIQDKKTEKEKALNQEEMPGSLGPNGFTNMSKSDFQIGKCKGQGKFGKIYPCKHIKTGTLYALKEIPKKIIKQNMMEDQLLRQVKLQYFFNHGNLVKLYGFFSDYENIYLLMEYMEEGELYSLLKKQKKFTEAYTASRVYEVCLALHYLHDMDVVHRDIKLENVVLSNGVAKLCDFGWAAVLDGRRTTYCGTFDYAPPEIIQGKEYDQNVDLWSLGVMTYEMLTGQLPFYNISRSETIKNILNVQQRKINFPADMSQKAQNFIEKLLKKNPEERVNIGMLLKHPFLEESSKGHKKF